MDWPNRGPRIRVDTNRKEGDRKLIELGIPESTGARRARHPSSDCWIGPASTARVALFMTLRSAALEAARGTNAGITGGQGQRRLRVTRIRIAAAVALRYSPRPCSRRRSPGTVTVPRADPDRSVDAPPPQLIWLHVRLMTWSSPWHWLGQRERMSGNPDRRTSWGRLWICRISPSSARAQRMTSVRLFAAERFHDSLCPGTWIVQGRCVCSAPRSPPPSSEPSKRSAWRIAFSACSWRRSWKRN